MSASSAPEGVRARVDRRVVLLDPVFVRRAAVDLLVLLLEIRQRLQPNLQARVGPINLEHLILLLVVLQLLRGRAEQHARLAALDGNREDRRVVPIAHLVGQVEAFLLVLQVRPLLHRLLPDHATLDVHRLQLNRRDTRRVLAQETDESDALHVVASRAQVEDAEIEPSHSLLLGDDRSQRVGEVLEQPILQLDGHAEDAIEELADAVVVLVQAQHARVGLAVDDQSDAHQRARHVREEVAFVVGRRRHHRRLVAHYCFHHSL